MKILILTVRQPLRLRAFVCLGTRLKEAYTVLKKRSFSCRKSEEFIQNRMNLQ